MKIIITENQLKKVVNILSEEYVQDSYFIDNDIYDYEPNNKEIDSFNKIDKSIKSDFRGFDNPDNEKRMEFNRNFGQDIKFKRETKPSGKNYTGRAKIVCTYPGGMQLDVKGSEGPAAVVVDKLKKIKKQNTKDAWLYSIKYEVISDKKRIYEEIHPSEAFTPYNAIKTIVDGKRNVGLVNVYYDEKNKDIWKFIGVNKLKLLKVSSNPYNMFVVYRDGYSNEANELKEIIDRNGGFATPKASFDDTFRIGKLLGYYEEDIKSYINKIKKQ
jgi:hypothetical protein